jgi:undecaprenyl-diphosphatase
MTSPHGTTSIAIRPASILRLAVINLTGWMAALVEKPKRRVPWLPGRRPKVVLALGAVVAVAAIAASMLLLDSWAILHRRGLPGSVVHLFQWITELGLSGWYLFPTGFLLLAIAAVASPRLGRVAYAVLMAVAARIGFVFLAIGAPGLFVTIVKRVIGRARPLHFDAGGPFDFAPFAWRVDYASLPSGHATTACAAATAFGALFPRARAVLWSCAAAIALSRIVVGAHYPSDVLAGAVVGGLGALLVRAWFAQRRLVFAMDRDGRIRPMPGPSVRRLKALARRVAGQ